MKIYKFGIIGCGMISNIHAKAIQSLEEAELVGVADCDPDRAKAFAKNYEIAAYSDADALLSDPNIDVVCICTPSGFHAEGALNALKRGKHVVLEKPMTLTTESAKMLVEACRENSCLLTVISQNRLAPDVKYVKELYDQKAFGTVSLVSLYMKYWRDPEYYSSSNWKGTKRFDGGGALMNQGIHGIDLLQYIAGEAKLIKGKVKTCFHDIEVEDTAAAILEFPDGALGIVEGSTCAYPGFQRRIEILGDSGYVILEENSIRELVVDKKPIEVKKTTNDASISSDPTALDYRKHAEQIQNLIDAIQGKADLLIDAEEGYRAVSLIESIYRSSESETP